MPFPDYRTFDELFVLVPEDHPPVWWDSICFLSDDPCTIRVRCYCVCCLAGRYRHIHIQPRFEVLNWLQKNLVQSKVAPTFYWKIFGRDNGRILISCVNSQTLTHYDIAVIDLPVFLKD